MPRHRINAVCACGFRSGRGARVQHACVHRRSANALARLSDRTFQGVRRQSDFGLGPSDDLVHRGPVTPIDLQLPPDRVKPCEPCVAATRFAATRPDDTALFIAGTLKGKGKWFNAVSQVLFAKTGLAKKVGQLDDCIMKPAQPCENGQFRSCPWMNSALWRDKQGMAYYGAGDRRVGPATAPAN